MLSNLVSGHRQVVAFTALLAILSSARSGVAVAGLSVRYASEITGQLGEMVESLSQALAQGDTVILAENGSNDSKIIG